MKSFILRDNSIRACLIACLIFISACSEIHQGAVYAKSYEEAWVQTSFNYIYGSKGEIMAMIPYFIHHPERFVLWIKHEDKKGWCYVSRAEYERIKIGDWVNCR